MTAEAEMVDVGPAADVPRARSAAYMVNGKSIAVFNFGDSLYAVDNHCPHQGAQLAGSTMYEGGKIRCMLHGWPIRLGACWDDDDLRRYPVRIEDGRLLVGTVALADDQPVDQPTA